MNTGNDQQPTSDSRHHVVIVGAGFGGLHAARALRRDSVKVTLIDRRNFHLFQPLLYQVATGELSPANISMPIRAVFKKQKNAEVLLGEVVGFDLANRRVLLANEGIAPGTPRSEGPSDGRVAGAPGAAEAPEQRRVTAQMPIAQEHRNTSSNGYIEFDSLIVAAGVRHHYFAHDEWEQFAPGLKSIEEATEIRRRILLAFEAAERAVDTAERKSWLRFVIVGGGPTGVEMAGAIAELSRYTLRRDFRHIDPTDAEILLVEAEGRVLTAYSPEMSQKAEQSLGRLGVTVRTSTRVESIDSHGVRVSTADSSELIATRTVIWAAGVRASPLGKKLADAADAELDRAGRVLVEPDLSLAGHPNVFVIGDLASCRDENGQPLPGVAPVAIQQGKYVAALIRKRLAGRRLPPFRFRDWGRMATIGRAAAVAEISKLKFNGLLAWLAWLFIHLMQLVGFQNRLLVLVQWAWNYFSRSRAARLITETNLSETSPSFCPDDDAYQQPVPVPADRSDETDDAK